MINTSVRMRCGLAQSTSARRAKNQLGHDTLGYHLLVGGALDAGQKLRCRPARNLMERQQQGRQRWLGAVVDYDNVINPGAPIEMTDYPAVRA